jgi:RluA family pseudouridine synthase
MSRTIPVLYQDEALLVVDKPAGLLTIPAPGGEVSLSDILNGAPWRAAGDPHLLACHRLDRETSGILVYARGKAVQKKMMEIFKHRRVEKTYLAFVQGNIDRPAGSLRKPLDGQTARTDYKLLERRRGYSVLEVHPHTGRTNQIRLHFAGIGHPLVGESRFAFRRDFDLKAKRGMLHAGKLAFPHPLTEAALSIEAPLPADMAAFLKKHA